MPEYVGVCVIMSKSAGMAFVLYFPIAIPYLRELHETRGYSLKENVAVSLRSKNFILSIVAESI